MQVVLVAHLICLFLCTQICMNLRQSQHKTHLLAAVVVFIGRMLLDVIVQAYSILHMETRACITVACMLLMHYFFTKMRKQTVFDCSAAWLALLAVSGIDSVELFRAIRVEQY